jgi:glycosyltransferase involved in cell wall biosynthesis
LKILIHYHDLVYRNEQNEWITTTNFGIWLNEISKHVKEIGVIAYETKTKTQNSVIRLRSNNIKIFSLGQKGNYFNHFERVKRVKRVCQSINDGWDHLIVRGITPSQHIIWYNTKSKFKSFLLVRSLSQDRKLGNSLLSIFVYIRNRINEQLSRKIIKSADIFFANSPSYFEEINFDKSKDTIFVPTNLVSHLKYPPIIKKKLDGAIKLLFVGRISYLKGLDELLHAAKILKGNNINFTLKIIADVNIKIFKSFEDRAIKLNIDENIEWVGFIPHGNELFKYYEDADIFVLPSYTEGFPRVYWEAAIFSTPVIVTEVGGIPDLITHKKHAMLIPKKDSNAIAKAVTDLISNNHLRYNLIDNGYNLAKRYPLEKSVQILVKSLKKLHRSFD